MTKAETIEEIRALLREPQRDTVSDPWNYRELDLVVEIRSALRNLHVMGLAPAVTMDESGTFASDPTETEGVLISLFVAERLISGDLIQKLIDGELGIYLNAGGDVIDTKTATIAFKEAAARIRDRFDTIISVGLATKDGSVPVAAAVFGCQSPYMA